MLSAKEAILKLRAIVAVKKVALQMLAQHVEGMHQSKIKKVKKAFWLSESMYLKELEDILEAVEYDPENMPRVE